MSTMTDEESLGKAGSGDDRGRTPSAYGRLSWGAAVSAIVLGGLSVVLTYLLVTELSRVLAVFAAGFVVAYFLEPAVAWLQRHRFSRLQAAWVVYLLVLAVLVLSVWAVVPHLAQQVLAVAENFPEYMETVIEGYGRMRTDIMGRIGSFVPDPRAFEFVDEQIPVVEDWAARNIPWMLRWGTQQILASVRGVGIVLLVLLIAFQVSILSRSAWAKIRSVVPPVHSEDVNAVSRDIGLMLGGFLRGVIVLFFANGIGAAFLIYLLGLFFGNEYALVVGVLTGITNMVPYIGPVVSVGSGVLLTYVTATTNPVLAAVLAGGLMLVMSQYFAMIVQPKIIGRRINLHPLVILFAMFGGYEIMGLVGIIIGMPVAGAIKIALARWVPVIGPDVTVRAPGEPLVLDIGSGLRNVHARFRRIWAGQPKAPDDQVHAEDAHTEDNDDQPSDKDE
jgi:predicted PurR-regulated permease PerM